MPTPCRVVQDDVSPILTHSYTLLCSRSKDYPTVTTCIQPVSSCTVLGCGAYIAADSRASSPDVNFGTLTPCCLACVLFTHWKL